MPFTFFNLQKQSYNLTYNFVTFAGACGFIRVGVGGGSCVWFGTIVTGHRRHVERNVLRLLMLLLLVVGMQNVWHLRWVNTFVVVVVVVELYNFIGIILGVLEHRPHMVRVELILEDAHLWLAAARRPTGAGRALGGRVGGRGRHLHHRGHPHHGGGGGHLAILEYALDRLFGVVRTFGHHHHLLQGQLPIWLPMVIGFDLHQGALRLGRIVMCVVVVVDRDRARPVMMIDDHIAIGLAMVLLRLRLLLLSVMLTSAAIVVRGILFIHHPLAARSFAISHWSATGLGQRNSLGAVVVAAAVKYFALPPIALVRLG